MNIKDFLVWRPNCYFCGEELHISPQFPALGDCEDPKYFIENECLHFTSRYIQVSIDIVSGFVDTHNKHSVDLAAFLARQYLEISAQCSQCEDYNRFYKHTATYKANTALTHMELANLVERIAVENLSLIQSTVKQKAIVNKLGSDKLNILSGTDIHVPWIDLSRTKPESLANKIRTCITFS
jgi:hypothetical protein